MPVIDFSNVPSCLCKDSSHSHIHCGVCEKPISLDGKKRLNDCANGGFCKKLELKNDWCVCDDQHVQTTITNNDCSCGVTQAHTHCLGCGKIINVGGLGYGN